MNDSHIRFRALAARYFTGEISTDEQLELSEILRNPLFRRDFDRLRGEQDFAKFYTLYSNVNPQLETKIRRRTLGVHRLKIAATTATAAIVVSVALWIGVFHATEPPQTQLFAEFTDHPIERPTLLIGKDSSRVLPQNESTLRVDTNADSSLTLQQRLVVPQGYTYSIVLPDGTHVKMNAGSSLAFPTRFEDTERRVELSGEAYFEVTHSTVPFRVVTRQGYVKVYGTRFDVNARQESVLKALLIEGRVGVGSEHLNEVKIAPNELCVAHTDGSCSIRTVNPADHLGWMEDVLRCTEGNFNDFIREIEAWYGVQFHYERSKYENLKLNISIDRPERIDEVVALLNEVLHPINLTFKKERSQAYELTKP